MNLNLNLVFLKSMNLNLKIKKKMNGSNPGREATVKHWAYVKIQTLSTSSRIDRASGSGTVDRDSIPGPVKPNTTKIHSFPT